MAGTGLPGSGLMARDSTEGGLVEMDISTSSVPAAGGGARMKFALAGLSDNGESEKEFKAEPPFLNQTTHCGPDCTIAATMHRSTESMAVGFYVAASLSLAFVPQPKSADVTPRTG